MIIIKPTLTINSLKKAAKEFCKQTSPHISKELFGTDNGKTIGTYIEQAFQHYLEQYFTYQKGSSAEGLDLPEKHIYTDIKTTSSTKPQSSSPFKNAQQKIFGLGYHVLLFVYHKVDDIEKKEAILTFVDCSFINKERTADYTTTFRLREMVEDGANEDDIVAYLSDRNIPADEPTLYAMAKTILTTPPHQGYLTISNALQWRLKYGRVVNLSEEVEGISKLIN